jgi:hypothetical protein
MLPRLDEQNRRRMANLRTKVRQMNDEISRNGGEKVQRWLHDNYNGSADIHSTKSFEIVQTSKNFYDDSQKSTSGINGC